MVGCWVSRVVMSGHESFTRTTQQYPGSSAALCNLCHTHHTRVWHQPQHRSACAPCCPTTLTSSPPPPHTSFPTTTKGNVLTTLASVCTTTHASMSTATHALVSTTTLTFLLATTKGNVPTTTACSALKSLVVCWLTDPCVQGHLDRVTRDQTREQVALQAQVDGLRAQAAQHLAAAAAANKQAATAQDAVRQMEMSLQQMVTLCEQVSADARESVLELKPMAMAVDRTLLCAAGCVLTLRTLLSQSQRCVPEHVGVWVFCCAATIVFEAGTGGRAESEGGAC